jgi:hypothetical protein
MQPRSVGELTPYLTGDMDVTELVREYVHRMDAATRRTERTRKSPVRIRPEVQLSLEEKAARGARIKIYSTVIAQERKGWLKVTSPSKRFCDATLVQLTKDGYDRLMKIGHARGALWRELIAAYERGLVMITFDTSKLVDDPPDQPVQRCHQPERLNGKMPREGTDRRVIVDFLAQNGVSNVDAILVATQHHFSDERIARAKARLERAGYRAGYHNDMDLTSVVRTMIADVLCQLAKGGKITKFSAGMYGPLPT